jgi:hypothetical protein
MNNNRLSYTVQARNSVPSNATHLYGAQFLFIRRIAILEERFLTILIIYILYFATLFTNIII